jgi:hypothetical protein
LATTFDYLICDGTSAYVFLHEVVVAYETLRQRRAPGLHPLPVQYADFSLWQRSWLTDERMEDQLRYWERTLAGAPLGPPLPFGHRPEVATRRLASVDLHVAPRLHAAVQALARSTRSTVFVLLPAVEALLARTTGRTDVMVSTTLSGHRRAEVQPQLAALQGADAATQHRLARLRHRGLGRAAPQTEFYDEATIAGLASGLGRLLVTAVDDPGRRLSQLPAAGGRPIGLGSQP